MALGMVQARPVRAENPRRNGTLSRSAIGEASWYGAEFGRRRTASGARFDPNALTGAHRTLPIGSVVRVTNLRNGRSVVVTITDRGPFRRHREIDVSLGAARALGFVERGVERVLIEPL
jgi:rare lipoprotein A